MKRRSPVIIACVIDWPPVFVGIHRSRRPHVTSLSGVNKHNLVSLNERYQITRKWNCRTLVIGVRQKRQCIEKTISCLERKKEIFMLLVAENDFLARKKIKLFFKNSHT